MNPCLICVHAAMAVHVAEAADVHEDVKAQGGARMEGPQGLVVMAAMEQAELNDFSDARGGKAGDDVAHLAVGMIAGPVDQRGCEFDFQRLGALNQIHQRRAGDGIPLSNSAAACSSSVRVWIRYWLGSAYLTSVGAVRTSRVSRLAASATRVLDRQRSFGRTPRRPGRSRSRRGPWRLRGA